MLKPKYNSFISGFFSVYINWIVKRHFHKIEFNKPNVNSEKSILLIANHFSWWDGFLIIHINKLFFGKRFYVMVLEESMRKIWFFKYIGAFSVAKNSRSVLESVDYAANLLRDPRNMVLIFPQGKLHSNFVNDVSFESGAAHIAAKAKTGFQYILAASFIENFAHKKPTAHIYFDTLSVDDIRPENIAGTYQQHYQTAKQQQNSITV